MPHFVRFAAVAVALLALAAPHSVAAQDSSALDSASADESDQGDPLDAIVGDWNLEQEDPELPICPVTLTADPAPGGYKVTVNATCGEPFPPVEQLTTWSLDDDGDILLMGSDQKVTFKMIETDDGVYATNPDGPGFYLIAPYQEDQSGGEDDAD